MIVATLSQIVDRLFTDYESALQSPTAPAGTPPAYSDKGFGDCKGAARLPNRSGVGPAPCRPQRGYASDGNRGGADRYVGGVADSLIGLRASSTVVPS